MLETLTRLAPDQEDKVSAADGIPLHYQEWRPAADRADNLKGTILLVHGFAEHTMRYSRFARALADAGFQVGGFDHRGMGRSGGTRGLVYDFSEYVDDISRMLIVLRDGLPREVPCFVYGHSMGGLAALLHAERRQSDPVAGTVLSGPLLGVKLRVPGWQVAMGRMLVGFAPRFRMPVNLNPYILTHDEEDHARLQSDRHLLKEVTLAWYFASGRAMQEAKAEAPRVAWPTLWLIPGEDKVCASEAARAVFRSLPDFGDHTWREYPGLFHELHNESAADRERVLHDLLEWLERQTARIASAA